MAEIRLEVLITLAIATWRLSFMITRETGPFEVFRRLRDRFPLGGLTTCLYCTSIWIALLAYVFWDSPARSLIICFAISGVALMLASYTGSNHT